MDSEDLAILYEEILYLMLMTLEHRKSIDRETFDYILDRVYKIFKKFNERIQNNEVMLIAAKREEEKEKRSRELNKEFKANENIPVYIKNFEVYNDIEFNLALKRKIKQLECSIERYRESQYTYYFSPSTEYRFLYKGNNNSKKENKINQKDNIDILEDENKDNKIENIDYENPIEQKEIAEFLDNIEKESKYEIVKENHFQIFKKEKNPFIKVNEIEYNLIKKVNLTKRYVFIYKIEEENKRYTIIEELRKVFKELDDYVMTRAVKNNKFYAYYVYIKFKTNRYEGIKSFEKYLHYYKKINRKYQKEVVLNSGELILFK